MPSVSVCNDQASALLQSIIRDSHHEIESFARAAMYKLFSSTLTHNPGK